MSVEHNALAYRLPLGSLATEAQAEAAKHPQTAAQISEEQLRLAALVDAEQIKKERGESGIDLSAVGQGMSSSSNPGLRLRLVPPTSPGL